jgi:CRISPR-associated protein Cas5d
MPQGIKLLVTGDFACFTRPEMKVERVSYDIITPSAARGILEAIYWKPQFRWQVKKIHVLKPIRWTSIRRNEVADKASAANAKKAMNGTPTRLGIEIEPSRQQRASLLLRDVAYGIEASIHILDHRFDRGGPALSDRECAGKHLATFERRARSGGHFHQPYFGTREFPAACTWLDQDQEFVRSPDFPDLDLNKDFGFMLHDLDYIETKEKSGCFVESSQGRRVKSMPRFFRATLENGVLDVGRCLAFSPNLAQP